VVFAKKMLKQTKEWDLVPQETYRTSGGHCSKSMIIETFFGDSSHVMHHPTAIGGEGF
jgi:hypothetical protein